MDEDDEEEVSEEETDSKTPVDVGASANSGTLTREQQLDITGAIIVEVLSALEKKQEELGRKGESGKEEYDQAMPMKSMRAEVIGTFDESAGGVLCELNPSEFDRITEWV